MVKLSDWIYELVGRRQPEADGHQIDIDDNEDSVTLYSCISCDTIFIHEDMDVCSRCGGAVNVTPSERDLGFNQQPS